MDVEVGRLYQAWIRIHDVDCPAKGEQVILSARRDHAADGRLRRARRAPRRASRPESRAPAVVATADEAGLHQATDDSDPVGRRILYRVEPPALRKEPNDPIQASASTFSGFA